MYRCLCVCLVAACAVADIRSAPVSAAAKSAKKIDVVICLDVSNSMDGLIASAKLKLWDIINDLARAKPAADLRVALYSYGHTSYDAKAGWVRKEIDFTNDLDELFKKLNGLTTRGGEEYVARVCRDALDQQKWADEKDALRLIFVCGNEPATQDPKVTLKEVADLAGRKNVIINCIFCGPASHADAESWKHLAALAGGRFGSIDQDRGTVAIATPQDRPLAELSEKLNSTYVVYGGREGREKAQSQTTQDDAIKKLAGKSAPSSGAASRATVKASHLYRNDSWDLCDRCKNDPSFDIKKVKKEDLSPELQKLTPAQLEVHVKKKLADRLALQKQINDLAAKRTEYLRAEQKKNPSEAEKAFDTVIRKTLREQAAKQGIAIPD